MTTTSNRDSRLVIAADALVNPIDFDQLVEAASHILVYADTTQLTLGAHYSVSGIGDEDGVEVTITAAGLAYDPDRWIVEHAPPIDQTVDLSGGGVFGRAYEEGLDALTRRMQALAEKVGRAVVFDALGDEVEDKLIGWEGGVLTASETPANEKTLREEGDLALASLIGQAGEIETAVYESQTALSFATVKQTITRVLTLGRGAPGDKGDGILARITLADATTLGVPSSALVRSQDRWTPDLGGIDATQGGYWIKSGPTVTPEQFGTDFEAAEDALAHAAIMELEIDFGQGSTYTTDTTLDVPTGSRIVGDAYFVFTDPAPAGTTADTTIITVGDNVVAEKLRCQEPGGESSVTSNFVVLIGNNSDIDYVEVTSQAQREKVAVQYVGEALTVKLGKIKTFRCDRGLMIENRDEFYNPDPDEFVPPLNVNDTDVVIGDIDIDMFATAFKPQFCKVTITGRVNIRGRSPYALKVPGANAILLKGCPSVDFLQPIYLANACEHGMRLGNVAEGGEEDDEEEDGVAVTYLRIPWIYVRDTGGCGFKGTQKSSSFASLHIGGISGTNIGGETYGHGEELVRLAGMDHMVIGPMYSYLEEGTYWDDYVHPVNGGAPVDLPNIWPRAALQIHDCNDFAIGPIHGTYRQQIIDINGGGDKGVTGGGAVENGIIYVGNAICEGATAIRFYASPAAAVAVLSIDNVEIKLNGARGWTDNLFQFSRDADPGTDPYPEITGPLNIFGFIRGTVGPRSDVNNDIVGIENIKVKVAWLEKDRAGSANDLRRDDGRLDAFAEWQPDADNVFDPSDVPWRGVVIGQRLAPDGIGLNGMPLMWGRLGENLAGGALVPYQSGPDPKNMGVKLYVGGTEGAEPGEALRLALTIDHTAEVTFEGPSVVGEVTALKTTADIAGIAPAAGIKYLQTSGLATAGDGGAATFIKVGVAKPGGATDLNGQHWRIADAVLKPAMFGVNTTPGTTNMTTALRNMSLYATEYNLPVTFAGSQPMVIDADADINYNHPMDFTGLEIASLAGGVTGSPAVGTVQNVWRWVSADTPVLTGTHDISGDDASTKLANSRTLTFSLFGGDGFVYMTGGAGQLPEVGGRAPTDPPLTYRQSFSTVKGKALQPLARDVAFTSISYRTRANDERGWMETKGLRYDTALGDNQCLILVQRNQTIIKDFVFDTSDPTSTDDTINRLISYEDCSSIVQHNIHAAAQVNASEGTYVIHMDRAAEIYTSQVTSHVNGWYIENCVTNRIDGHDGLFNVFVEGCTLHDIGIKYGWGGGTLSVSNSKAINCPIISSRSDYGGYWYGQMVVDSVDFVSDAFDLIMVDLSSEPIGCDTVEVPCPEVSISNVRRSTRDDNTSTVQTTPLAIAVRSDALGLQAPMHVTIDGVYGGGGWRFAMPIAYDDMINNPLSQGNNHHCRVQNVHPTTAITAATQGLYVPANTVAGATIGTVAFYLENLRAFALNAEALGDDAVVFANDVNWSRCVLGGNTRAEVVGGSLGTAAIFNAETVCVFGGAWTSGTSFSSLKGVSVRGGWDLSRVRSFSGVDIPDGATNSLVVLPTGCSRSAAMRGWQSKSLYAIQAQHHPDVTLAELATMTPANWTGHTVRVSDAAAGAGQLAYCDGAAWGVIAIGAAPA
jgi:hypothetical protein